MTREHSKAFYLGYAALASVVPAVNVFAQEKSNSPVAVGEAARQAYLRYATSIDSLNAATTTTWSCPARADTKDEALALAAEEVARERARIEGARAAQRIDREEYIRRQHHLDTLEMARARQLLAGQTNIGHKRFVIAGARERVESVTDPDGGDRTGRQVRIFRDGELLNFEKHGSAPWRRQTLKNWPGPEFRCMDSLSHLSLAGVMANWTAREHAFAGEDQVSVVFEPPPDGAPEGSSRCDDPPWGKVAVTLTRSEGLPVRIERYMPSTGELHSAVEIGTWQEIGGVPWPSGLEIIKYYSPFGRSTTSYPVQIQRVSFDEVDINGEIADSEFTFSP